MLSLDTSTARPAAATPAPTEQSGWDVLRAQAAARAPIDPPAMPAPASVAPAAAAGGMIFLRRNETHWLIAFHGIKGLTNSELPLPFHRHETLRDVLVHLSKTYAGQLAGAWLLVAP